MAVAHVCGSLAKPTRPRDKRPRRFERVSVHRFRQCRLFSKSFPLPERDAEAPPLPSLKAISIPVAPVLALYKAVAEIPETSGEARLFQHALSGSSLVDCVFHSVIRFIPLHLEVL
ncbi:hypothetical protein M422DRAFT_243684 [Sphaerobolus stellatus SS14]|nr:hypothetical protein M422DRAFT_243684 [Sphaerobolus stellatus SS14]